MSEQAYVYNSVMSILGKFFPETIFPRKLSVEAEQRMRLAQARAEEALIRTHVENALMFVDILAPDIGYERALDVYIRELGVPEPLASVIATRALVALGDALVTTPADEQAPAAVEEEPLPLPKLRIDEAGGRRRRA
jgi:hypothetical protein